MSAFSWYNLLFYLLNQKLYYKEWLGGTAAWWLGGSSVRKLYKKSRSAARFPRERDRSSLVPIKRPSHLQAEAVVPPLQSAL